jgi:hypothetical protein
MQIRWAVGLVLVAALAGCGESAEAKYARALQVYNAELELRQRASEAYQATYNPKAAAYLDRKLALRMEKERKETGDTIAAFVQTDEERKAEIAEMEKVVLADPEVKRAEAQLAEAERRLDYAAKLVRECEAARH